MRLVIGPTCNEWSLMYLGTMVFIWASLSKRAIQLSPFILTLAMFLTLYHCQKGVWIQEGSLWSSFYTSGASVLGLFTVLAIVRGVQAPFIDAIPSFPFNCFLSLEVFNKWAIADEMFQAATVVAAFLICLGIFDSPCQMDHELLGHTLDSARIITLWILIITIILFF